MDGNNQIVPIATGVSHGETGESWTWFLLKFKECICEVPNLAIITDRHPAIILACNTIFPNAFHGYCCRHLMMNCKMKSDKLQAIYWKTCKAYTPEEFQRRVSDLCGFRPEAYKKLKDVGFDTWSRAMCPTDHYNYMTLNSAESINNLTRHVRKAPITKLMEWYRALLQKWYCARRDKYKDSYANTLSDWATHKVMDRMQKSAHWKLSGKQHFTLLTKIWYIRWGNYNLGTACHEPIANYQDSTQPRLKRSRQTRQESNIHVDLGGYSQEYEAAYTNNYMRLQEYEAAYTNNYVRSQEYEAAYTNFNSMFEQANINFGGQSQHPLPTTLFTFSQFNLGQNSQQTYSAWDSSLWDPVNLADP
nr:transposase, MuDR, MULE transposase domain protein [Tanacetum cinerariifolium]